jgi:hypothetical protein
MEVRGMEMKSCKRCEAEAPMNHNFCKICGLEFNKAAAVTTAVGQISIPPEEFKAILDAAPVIKLNPNEIIHLAEPLKPCIPSKEFDGSQFSKGN